MYKYFISFLILLISSLSAFAQQSVGQWKIYPIVGAAYEKIIDSKDKVYFLSSSSLYSYDKKTKETYFYNASNKLSSSNISNIYYNHDKNYLVVVYTDSNIDIIYDDGTTYALPEIKDANLTIDKTINDIGFGDGRIAVATNFGLVIYDDKKHEVIESCIYNFPVINVDIFNGKLIICAKRTSDAGEYIQFSNLTDRHNSLEKFSPLNGGYVSNIMVLNDELFVMKNIADKQLTISAVSYEASKLWNTKPGVTVDSDIYRYKDGFYFKSGNKILFYDNKAQQTASYTLPDDLKNENFALWTGLDSVWFGGKKGSANYDLSEATPKVLSDWYRPESITCKEVVYMSLSPDNQRIYLTNLGPTQIRTYLPHYGTAADGLAIKQTTNVIENGQIRDVSIVDAKLSVCSNYQRLYGDNGMYGGTARLAEDPENPDTYYISNGQEGVFVVKGTEQIHKFDIYNSPFFYYWNTRCYDVNFDPQGNLWVGHDHTAGDYPPYIVLPASKLRKGFENITKEDWEWPKLTGMVARSKDFISLFAKKSNYAFFVSAKGVSGLHILNTKGTYDNLNDDTFLQMSTFTDQDGNLIRPTYIYSVVEDHDGRIWCGTTGGLFYVNAQNGINENTTVVRPKVPRNDGTNYADFLLDSDKINCIAVDPSNRKWIATDFSGVFLVSADGDKIIKQFDTTNSPLPSNRVISVICDPNSNDVYFGTLNGLLSYKADSSPAAEDFSDVYAYPNPVKPDYTGWITVAGLMDNSLVKITDTAGNVLYQTRSEGGMITWDGCNLAGERVRSGIYYVYASTGGDGQQSNGVVTKIMVIN